MEGRWENKRSQLLNVFHVHGVPGCVYVCLCVCVCIGGDLCRVPTGRRSLVTLYQTLLPFRSNLEGLNGGANVFLMILQRAVNMAATCSAEKCKT